MTSPADLTPGRPLLRCPKWPTMQWLPQPVIDRLGRLVDELTACGFKASRGEVICSLVLGCDPTRVDLEQRLYAYKVQPFNHQERQHPPRAHSRPLALKLPSPITLRIDGLVRAIRDKGGSAYRHELIGALIMDAPNDLADLKGLCRDFRRAPASKAVIPGQPKRWVLSTERPSPGARTHVAR